MIVLRVLFVLLPDLFCALLALIVRAAWGDELRFQQGMMTVYVKDSSWICRKFPTWHATTLSGHVVLLAHTSADEEALTLRHEAEHVEQFEVLGLLGLVVGALLCAVHPALGIVVWGLVPVLGYLCGSVIALLYGREWYRGNSLERAAYALADHRK
jgi:hypothetical protein